MAARRTFIALALPDDARRALVRLQHDLGPAPRGLRWSDLRQSHLTLAFLGDLDAATRRRAVVACREATATGAPFRLGVADVGAFPNPRAARVLWAGVDVGGALTELHRALADALDGREVPRDRRPLAPHVTLARARRGADARALANAGAGWTGPSWTVTCAEVLVSRATAHGHVHRVVARCPLGGARPRS